MLRVQHFVKYFYFTPIPFRLYCNNIIISISRTRTHPSGTLIGTYARESNYFGNYWKKGYKKLQNGLIPCKRSSPVVEYRHGNGLDRKGSSNPNNARSEGAEKSPDKSFESKRSFPERKEMQKQIVRNGAHAKYHV